MKRGILEKHQKQLIVFWDVFEPNDSWWRVGAVHRMYSYI